MGMDDDITARIQGPDKVGGRKVLPPFIFMRFSEGLCWKKLTPHCLYARERPLVAPGTVVLNKANVSCGMSTIPTLLVCWLRIVFETCHKLGSRKTRQELAGTCFSSQLKSTKIKLIWNINKRLLEKRPTSLHIDHHSLIFIWHYHKNGPPYVFHSQ